jgi:hypothetical protein
VRACPQQQIHYREEKEKNNILLCNKYLKNGKCHCKRNKPDYAAKHDLISAIKLRLYGYNEEKEQFIKSFCEFCNELKKNQ